MGLDATAKLAGFFDYFGMDEYDNDDDFDGYWGIWDEPYLQYFANKMQTFREPFMTTHRCFMSPLMSIPSIREQAV